MPRLSAVNDESRCGSQLERSEPREGYRKPRMSSRKGGQLLLCWLFITVAPGLFGWNNELAWKRDEYAPGGQSKVRDAAVLGLVEMGKCKACAYSTAGLGAIAQDDVPERVRRGDRVMPNSPTDVPDLKSAPPRRHVTAIGHCGDMYRIKTADGRINKIAESDLRFRTDSSNVGPKPGKPVIVSPMPKVALHRSFSPRRARSAASSTRPVQ